MERKKGQRYSKKFRQQGVERMHTRGIMVRLARELGVDRTLLHHWRVGLTKQILHLADALKLCYANKFST